MLQGKYKARFEPRMICYCFVVLILDLSIQHSRISKNVFVMTKKKIYIRVHISTLILLSYFIFYLD